MNSGLTSSLQQSNEKALLDYELCNGLTMVVPELRLLVDPQTSGGLLAAVPEQNVTRCLDRLSSQGYTCACIGRIEDKNWSIH